RLWPGAIRQRRGGRRAPRRRLARETTGRRAARRHPATGRPPPPVEAASPPPFKYTGSLLFVVPKGCGLAPHPELVAEQNYLDRVYERLCEQRERASAQLSDVLMQGGVTPQSVVEREMLVEQAQMRLGQL